jgi:hypothetical protein
MAAPLNVHGNVTLEDGTRHDDLQIVVRGNTATLRQRLPPRTVIADRGGVKTMQVTSRTTRLITFENGETWQVERTSRPCCGQ